LEFTLASRSSEPAKVSPEVVMDQLTEMFEGKAKNDLVIEWIEVKRIFGTIFLTNMSCALKKLLKVTYIFYGTIY
jgi:hypothetical protein